MREKSIGHVATSIGCKVQTIRYYEQIGLLPKPPRSHGNQRQYDTPTIQRLVFIRHARELGFPLEAIRDLLSLSDQPDRSCAAADAIARTQLSAVERRLSRLRALKNELERMVEQCKGGRIAGCRVIETLADHSLCTSHEHAGAPV